MKHFLLSIVFVSAGVIAFANPFDLKENLQKIDQDQDILLSALKEMADKKEAQELENEPVSTRRNVEEVTREESISQEQKPNDNNEVAQAQKVEEDRRMEEKRLAKAREQQIQMQQSRAEQAKMQEAEKEAEELAAKKRETEKQEVAVYEAKRRAKIDAEKAQEEARKAEQKAVELKAAKLKEQNAIVDIDIEKEEQMAKSEADKAYLKAIKEMH